jgi:hypothetical protein
MPRHDGTLGYICPRVWSDSLRNDVGHTSCMSHATSSQLPVCAVNNGVVQQVLRDAWKGLAKGHSWLWAATCFDAKSGWLSTSAIACRQERSELHSLMTIGCWSRNLFITLLTTLVLRDVDSRVIRFHVIGGLQLLLLSAPRDGSADDLTLTLCLLVSNLAIRRAHCLRGGTRFDLHFYDVSALGFVASLALCSPLNSLCHGKKENEPVMNSHCNEGRFPQIPLCSFQNSTVLNTT